MTKEKIYFSIHKNIEDRLEYIWECYKSTVDLYYRDVYELHNDYFPLYKGMKFIYISINFDDLLGIAYLLKGSYEGLNIEKKELPHDFIETSIGRQQSEIIERITKVLSVNKNDLYYSDPIPLSDLTTLRFDTSDKDTGRHMANLEFENFNKHRSQIINEYNPPVIQEPDLPITISKYVPLLEIVEDEDFKYELQEAYQCFKNNQYLASSLVVGRLIETSLKILIIKKLGEEAYFEISSAKRTIGILTDLLERKRIISSTEKNGIMAAAMIRNSVSHSTGKTDFKANIHIMFSQLVAICNKIPN